MAMAANTEANKALLDQEDEWAAYLDGYHDNARYLPADQLVQEVITKLGQLHKLIAAS